MSYPTIDLTLEFAPIGLNSHRVRARITKDGRRAYLSGWCETVETAHERAHLALLRIHRAARRAAQLDRVVATLGGAK